MGSGAREHALCRSLGLDPDVGRVTCAPGNAGTATVATNAAVDAGDPDAVTALAVSLDVDLVVIGPEVPLVAGAADAVRATGIACFGPSAAAAELEGSKAFAKEIMAAADVPTSMAHICETPAEAAAALDAFGPPYVVKDDGLAAGKGVVVTDDREAALAHAAACDRVVIEEYLDGPEVSLFCITDGTTVVPLVPAQDFKRALDGDAGPNTGGMGAYSPLPWAPDSLVDDIVRTVVQPTVDEMHRRGTPFAGLLYAGLALTSRGLRVVEFNARFGDPETQVVLARLLTPLGGVLRAAATGHLDEFPDLRWTPDAAVDGGRCRRELPRCTTHRRPDRRAGRRERDPERLCAARRNERRRRPGRQRRGSGAVGGRHRSRPGGGAIGRLRSRWTHFARGLAPSHRHRRARRGWSLDRFRSAVGGSYAERGATLDHGRRAHPQPSSGRRRPTDRHTAQAREPPRGSASTAHR